MRGRYERRRSGIQKIWLLTALVMLILVSTGGTLAAYVSRSYVRGVAATPKQGFPLSSDYLSAVSKSAESDTYPDKKIVLTEKAEGDTEPYTLTFSIMNTADGSVSTKRMQYYLKMSGLPEGATVQNGKGEKITLSVISDDGYKAPVMYAYTSVKHTYTITIPKKSMASAADIIVTAKPDADSDTSGFMLAGRLQPSILGTVAVFSYKGSFLEDSTTEDVSNYAAFNYQISVSNAVEPHQMQLTWKHELIEIDPLFLEMLTNSGISYNLVKHEEEKTSTLSFKMDDTNSSYLIQFYRLGEPINNWSDLGITFIEAQSEENQQ